MMLPRYVFDADKLVISKKGFDVLDPNLDDKNKIFDSRWPFTGFLIDSGVEYNRSGTVTVPFTDSGVIPVVEVREFRRGDYGDEFSGFQDNPSSTGIYKSSFNFPIGEVTVFSNRFVVALTRQTSFYWFIYAVPGEGF